MYYSTNKFNLDFFFKEIHYLATEINENRKLDPFCSCTQFSHSSLEEKIAMAKLFIYPTEDPSLKEAQLQLDNDIKILSAYLMNVNSSWQSSNILQLIFRNLFQYSEVPKQSKEISRMILQEALDFLNDFAPNRARGFQNELKIRSVQILYQLVIDEIEYHIEDISKAIAARHDLLSLYSQPGSFNKLLRLKKNISLLISLFKENRFKEPEKSYKIVYQALSKDLDLSNVDVKAIELLKNIQSQVDTCYQKQRKQIEMWRLKTVGEFMSNYFNGIEVSMQSILEQFSKHLQVDFPTDWFEPLKRNSMIRMEIQIFCRQFCREEEHAAKIRIFHNFITDWLEKYPPSSKVGSEEMLSYIQSIFILADSPELLLNVLLLEQDSISFQPHAPNLMNSDYTPEEVPNASGINCYDYLNLMNALSAMCQKSSLREMELEILQKKGNVLHKKFSMICDLNFISPRNMPSNKQDLETKLLLGKSNIQRVFHDKLKAYRLKQEWQYVLLKNEAFIKDAASWAENFCSEINSIDKLNQHRARVLEMVEKYVPLEHEPLDFLATLLKAADNSNVVAAIALIESDTVAWRISEGFIGDIPVNAIKRKEDLKILQALINQF